MPWDDVEVEQLYQFLCGNVDAACAAVEGFEPGSREMSYLGTYDGLLHLFEHLLAQEPNGDWNAIRVASALSCATWAWMPAVLCFRSGSADAVCNSLIAANHGEHWLQVDQITNMRLAFTTAQQGATLSGPSKMLHFARPDRYAILDRKVIRRMGELPIRPQVRPAARNDSKYLDYCDAIQRLPDESEQTLLDPINAALGLHELSPVGRVRAADIILFNAPAYGAGRANLRAR